MNVFIVFGRRSKTLLYLIRSRGRWSKKGPWDKTDRRQAEYDGPKYQKRFDSGEIRYSGVYEVADYEFEPPPT